MTRWLAVLVLLGACARNLPEPELQARCEEGLGQSCLDLGLALAARNPPGDATPWFDRACARGSVQGCLELAHAFEVRWHAVPALESARNLYRMACLSGSSPSSCDKVVALDGQLATARGRAAAEDERLADAIGKKYASVDCTQRANHGLEKDDIRAVVSRHSPEIHACYSLFLARVGQAGAVDLDVSVSWTIGADGLVTKTAVFHDTLPSSGVAACIQGAVQHWRFPPPACGGMVEVTFPWLLRVAQPDE